MTDHLSDAWRGTMKRRLTVAAVCVLVWAIVIQARLVQLQVFRYDELRSQADRQQSSRRKLPARRGEIIDRNGEVLAYSVRVDTITAVPRNITEPQKTVQRLCSVLECSADDRRLLLERFSSDRLFAPVRRFVTQEEAERIEAMKLKGIEFIKEDRRFYPSRELAAHVLGFVGTDQTARGGVESTFDSVITGSEGSVRVQLDEKRQEFISYIERTPTAGATVELTIDVGMQHIVERELARGVSENQAIAGSAMVMDPVTGEILAMASVPTFNPNRYTDYPEEHWRNRPVQDVYEPGSTFKMVTAAAALEQGIVHPDDVIDVSGGRLAFGPRDVIRDISDYKRLTFSDVIVKSSNVGAAKVAQQLGAERLTEAIRKFGFGRATSRQDFPAERAGKVWPANRLKNGELARVAIGYQVGVTALQVATAASSIANGGELVMPRVLRAIWRNGQRLAASRTVLNRTVPPGIAAELTTIMEGVVAHGTATSAQIPGYTVAGKTGTAEKLRDGRYQDSEHNASFVGFVPSRSPKYTIIVVIDTPRGPSGHYGGPVAGPIFKRIAEGALRYGRVPPTLNAPPPVLAARNADESAHERPASSGDEPSKVVAAVVDAGRDGIFPDMTGMSARDAAGALTRLGLVPALHGTGLVRSQRPAAGTPIDAGAKVTLWLDREPIPDGTDGPAR